MIEPVQNLEETEFRKWIHMKGAPQNCMLNDEENLKAFFRPRNEADELAGNIRQREN